MRKRQYRARVWLNEQEYCQFIKNVEKTGLTQETYLRRLIKDYHPKEMPPIEYFEILRQLMMIGNNMNQITVRLNSMGNFDPEKYDKYHKQLMKLVVMIQKAFESPE